MINNKLCIYHGNCTDGFGAAFAMFLKYNEAEYLPMSHGQEPPDVTGKDVFILDFSFKRDVMLSMAEQANSITVLDHHVSAEKELLDLISMGVILGEFDMDRSGAMMSWEYFHKEKEIPRLYHYIQDRDLWRNELPNTKAIAAYIQSQPFDNELWSNLLLRDLSEFIEKGQAILDQKEREVNSLIENTRPITLNGQLGGVINCPHYLASDALDALCKKFKNYSFGLGYYIGTDEDKKPSINCSLRSLQGKGADCSEIAGLFGGGGHRHASGFLMNIKEIDLLL